jgi:UDP-N-acetylbacillosamine N-acetyltransferase
MSKKKILIFGIGPFSKTVASLCKDIESIEVIGFFIDDEYFNFDEFMGLPVFKYSEVNPNESEIISCVGYKSMRKRKSIFERLSNDGFKFANIIHQSATICSGFNLGKNNIIFPNVCIEPNVELGNNNIIWSKTLLGHDCKIQNHCYIAADVLVGGNSLIKENSFLGNSTSMINDIIIEEETYLVAGSFLYNSTEKYNKYFGIPARKISSHLENGIEI